MSLFYNLNDISYHFVFNFRIVLQDKVTNFPFILDGKKTNDKEFNSLPKKEMVEDSFPNFFRNIVSVTWFMIDGRINFLQ